MATVVVSSSQATVFTRHLLRRVSSVRSSWRSAVKVHTRSTGSSSAAAVTSMTYNFGSVSEKAPAVFGVEAPGVPMKPGGVYNEAGSVPNAVVEEWAAFLKAEGVTRTICLLKAEELACYAAPGYAKILEAQGITPSMVDIFQEGASDAIKAAAGAAKAAGEKVAVHCSGGEGRTGLALGAVLVSECGMTPPDAAAEVVRHSAELGTVRKVKTEKLEALLANGHA